MPPLMSHPTLALRVSIDGFERKDFPQKEKAMGAPRIERGTFRIHKSLQSTALPTELCPHFGIVGAYHTFNETNEQES